MSPGGKGVAKLPCLPITAVKISGSVATEKRINVTFQKKKKSLASLNRWKTHKYIKTKMIKKITAEGEK